MRKENDSIEAEIEELVGSISRPIESFSLEDTKDMLRKVARFGVETADRPEDALTELARCSIFQDRPRN